MVECGDCNQKIKTTLLKHIKGEHPQLFKALELSDKKRYNKRRGFARA